MTVKVNAWLTQCYITVIRLVSMTHFNYKTTPTNDTDYRCNIKAVELVEPTILGPYHTTSCHWLLLASGMDTQTHRHVTGKIIFRKQACTWFKDFKCQ